MCNQLTLRVSHQQELVELPETLLFRHPSELEGKNVDQPPLPVAYFYFVATCAQVTRTVRSPMKAVIINGGGNALHHFLRLLQRARLSMNVFCTLISITIIDFSLNNELAASWQRHKRA